MIRICNVHFLPLDHAAQCLFCRHRDDTSPILFLDSGLIRAIGADDAYIDLDELAESHRFEVLRDPGFEPMRHRRFRRRDVAAFVGVVNRNREWLETFFLLRKALEIFDERVAASLAAVSRRETDYACSHRSGSPEHCSEMVLKGGLVDDDQRGGSAA